MIVPILTHPDTRLKETSVAVEAVDDGVRELVQTMFDTLYHSGGIGLAAPQIGVLRRVIVLDLGRDGARRPYACINPEIVKSRGEVASNEGCLSIPGQRLGVPRAKSVDVRFLDEHGRPQRVRADGLMAACFQHEIDHLNGRLLNDPR